jgi:hypothetical protein
MINSGAHIVIQKGGKVVISGNFSNLSSAEADGTLLNNGSLYVSGNWSNSAGNSVFDPSGTGDVVLDGGDQAISGKTEFYNLSKHVVAESTLKFNEGAAGLSIIDGTLRLGGVDAGRLLLRSNAEGLQWQINPKGKREVSYLDVKDSYNVNPVGINTLGYNCMGSGINTNWIFPSYYDIRFTAGPGGSISGTANQAVPEHGDCTPLTAIPDSGYLFTMWTRDGASYSSANPLRVTDVTGNLSITANFAAVPLGKHSVTFIAGTGGTISGMLSQVVNDGENSSPVTAVPGSGNQFVKWTIDGADCSSDNPLQLINVKEDLIITANFAETPHGQHVVTFVANAGGAIAGNVSQVIIDGQDCEPVIAVADPQYFFDKWTRDGKLVSQQNPLTVTNVAENMKITANFALLDMNVKVFVKSNLSAGGNVSFDSAQHPKPDTGPSISTSDKTGETLNIAASPMKGYVFSRWTWTGAAEIADPTSAATTVVLQNDTVLVANFADSNVTALFTVEASPAEGGNTVPAGQSVVYSGSVKDLTALSAPGFKFVGWNRAGNAKIQDAHQPLTTVLISDDTRISAVFEPVANTVDFTLSVAATSLEGGSVESAGTSRSQIGIARKIKAICAYGYAFDHWQVIGNAGIDNIYSMDATVIPSDNVSVIAHFARLELVARNIGRVYIYTNNKRQDIDRIRIVRAGLLLEKLDPENDTISVTVEGNTFEINNENGRFVHFRWGWIYYSDNRKIRLILNLKGNYWNFTANRFTFEKFNNLDGTNMLLKVNDSKFGANLILDERKYWRFDSNKDYKEELAVGGDVLDECSFNLAGGVMNNKLRCRDRLWINSSIAAMPADEKFEPATMDVSLCVGSFSALIPAGSFRTVKDNLYSYSNAGNGMLMVLDFSKNTWRISLYKKDIWSKINPEGGLETYLEIGGFGGAQKLIPTAYGTYRKSK